MTAREGAPNHTDGEAGGESAGVMRRALARLASIPRAAPLYAVDPAAALGTAHMVTGQPSLILGVAFLVTGILNLVKGRRFICFMSHTLPP